MEKGRLQYDAQNGSPNESNMPWKSLRMRVEADSREWGLHVTLVGSPL
jgi:hypothetical protein